MVVDRIKKVCSLALIFMIFLPGIYAGSKDLSKVGTTSAIALEIPVDPRGVAMGCAVIADNNPNSSTLYWNPALATRINRITMRFVSMPYLVDTKFFHASVVVPTPFLTVGAYISTWSMGDMKVRTEYYQNGTGEMFNAGDMVIGISVARNLTDHFAIGGTIKYIQERIWHCVANGFAIDFGSIFTIDIWNGIRIGTSLRNYGTEMQMNGRDLYHYHDPDETMDGNNENIISGYVTNKWMLPLSFKLGVSTDIVRTSPLRWTLEIDARHPNNNYESLDFGTEIEFNKVFLIRVGVERVFLRDEKVSLGAGFGLRLPPKVGINTGFDYGFKDFGDLGYVHSFSVELGI